MSTAELSTRLTAIETEAADIRKQLEQAQEPVLIGDLAGPSDSGFGWCLLIDGVVDKIITLSAAKKFYAAGNWFATRQSAQNAAKVREVTQRFKIAVAAENARCERAINWRDSHQAKWYFLFNHTDSSIECNWTGYTQVVPANMCFTKKAEDALREQFTEAELRMVVTQEVVE